MLVVENDLTFIRAYQQRGKLAHLITNVIQQDKMLENISIVIQTWVRSRVLCSKHPTRGKP